MNDWMNGVLSRVWLVSGPDVHLKTCRILVCQLGTVHLLGEDVLPQLPRPDAKRRLKFFISAETRLVDRLITGRFIDRSTGPLLKRRWLWLSSKTTAVGRSYPSDFTGRLSPPSLAATCSLFQRWLAKSWTLYESNHNGRKIKGKSNKQTKTDQPG